MFIKYFFKILVIVFGWLFIIYILLLVINFEILLIWLVIIGKFVVIVFIMLIGKFLCLFIKINVLYCDNKWFVLMILFKNVILFFNLVCVICCW